MKILRAYYNEQVNAVEVLDYETTQRKRGGCQHEQSIFKEAFNQTEYR